MATSSNEVFADAYFLYPPVKRAAYSDRMAFLMAEMSKLAYVRFELLEDSERSKRLEDIDLDNMIGEIRSAQGVEQARQVLQHFLLDIDASYESPSKAYLTAELRKANFELFNTYDLGGTAAFLAVRHPKDGSTGREKGIAVLSFRGTEQNNSDWKANLKAQKRIVNGVPVHSGFWEAFQLVKTMIQTDLTELLKDGYSLYLSGHSLGGALALIAAHEIGNDSTEACYTFGAPRVAGYGFAAAIKTPIYRVVNANDVVPRLPPAFLPHILQFIVAVLPIPGQSFLTRLLDKFTGYAHHGDMRYLRRSKRASGGGFDRVQLLSNSNMLHRLRWFVSGFIQNPKSPIEDHSIETYSEKLKQYALQRSNRM